MKKIYVNGQVYTGSLPLKEAFAEEDGKFIFAGLNEEAKALFSEGDEIIDLSGKFVCSSFNDSHMHLVNYGNVLQSAELAKHTNSLADMISYFHDFAKEHPVSEDAWYVGRGWNQDYFADEKRLPTRWDLDKVSSEHPVLAIRCCIHALCVNSKALELLGLTADTPEPEGGKIGKQNGELDGTFFDNAMQLVYDAMPVPTKEDLKEKIRLACRALNAYGITSCQTDDYCTYRTIHWSTFNEAFRELEEAGELTVRVYEQCNFTTLPALREFVEAGNTTGKGTNFFKIGPLKMLGDGSLGARTAYLSRPYADSPSEQGFPVFTQETMDELVSYANKMGLQCAIHAIGDGCLDNVLEAYEKALSENPRENHRHGVVHCQISRPEQLQKIADLNLHIYCQSIFLDYDNHIVLDRVGKELADSSYRWKTLMKNGVTVSNGSDCPVEYPNVLGSMQCAVTRTTLYDHVGPYLPDEAFSVKEAIDSYTSVGAYASFEEGQKGSIAPGYLADFVILEKNPFEIPADQIKDIRILKTYVDGKCVFG